MNNIVNNPKTLARLWAALSCDFEGLLAKFMASKGWRYIHFAAICREMQITLIMHITQGRGKTKDEHYYRIMDMILQLCKNLWLRRPLKGPNKFEVDEAMELKRALGGFFLLYTMYERQPCRGKVKVSLGLADMVAFNLFNESIKRLPYYQEIAFMLQHLRFNGAFHYCIFSEEYRFEASTRNFLNINHSEVVALTKKMRDAQDVLAYSSVHGAAEKSLEALAGLKSTLAKDMMKTLDEDKIRQHFTEQSTFATFVKGVIGGRFSKTMHKLDHLLDKPIMTLQSLTATEAVDRRIMMETRRRMERARKKALQGQDHDGEQKTVRPYVREGGIFGRKKETEEGDDKTKRRERGACNGNLWIYINGLDFDKPLIEESISRMHENDVPVELKEDSVDDNDDSVMQELQEVD